MKWISAVVVIFLSLNSTAQFSVGGGLSSLFQFGNPKPFLGAHLTVEFPRNNEVTFYGRLTYHFKQKNITNENSSGQVFTMSAFAINPSTNPQFVNLPASFEESFNYVSIDGGTRYYLINGYDEGFSLYGGTNIAFIINTAKYKQTVDWGTYDSNLYTFTDADQRLLEENKGTIINLAAGVTGGVKYTIPARGTFYFDINPSLMLFGLPSDPNLQTSFYKQVIFNFNIGYRKELY